MRRTFAAVVVALVALGFGLAHTGAAGAATYTVCGDGVVLPIPGGGTCMTLSAAITAAQATPEADTIRMLPGTYCPIDLEGTTQQPIKFIGVGLAGLSGGPIGLSGPEAGLTTIEANGTSCSATDIVNMNMRVASNAPMVFQNITVDGSAGGSIGFSQQGVATNTVLRDDIFQNFNTSFGEGIKFTSGFSLGQDTTLDLDNSAIIDNTFGVDLEGATASMYDSTVAGNTNTGLVLGNSEIASFGSDTISHNKIGVTSSDGGFGIQVVDTIVAGNKTRDCSGPMGDWETGNGSSFGNLFGTVGGSNCPTLGSGDIRDTTLTDGTMPAVQLNGGPTPSILPPLVAQGKDNPSCGLDGVDQREFKNPSTSTCDIGAVQTGANGVATVAAGNANVGTVAIGGTKDGTVSATMSGGGLVGVSGVSISGAGWSVSNDGCTFTLMETTFFAPLGNGCNVGVTDHPSASGIQNGTLVIHTTAGDVTAHLQADAVTAPSISSFSPVTGPLGTTVTIVGSGFAGAIAVSFNGTPAASFTVDSDTQITAVVASGTTTGLVTVTGANGTGTSGRAFIVATPPLPIVRGFTPSQGLVGTTVTITGSHFTGATGVSFNGTPAVTFLVVSDTVITTVVPPGATSGQISVTNGSGTISSIAAFTVLPAVAPAPTITSFTPTSGTHGVRVVLHGSGFTGATSVKFNGQAALFTVVNDSTIYAYVPVGTTSGTISVTTPAGTGVSAGSFTAH